MFNLSPLGRRRLKHFKANRRGWWSLWIFIGLFVVCLGGELIANDKPLTDGLVEQEVKQQFGQGFTHNVLTVSQISQQEYQAQAAIHDKH